MVWVGGSKDGRQEVLELELSCTIPMYKEAGEWVHEWEPWDLATYILALGASD